MSEIAIIKEAEFITTPEREMALAFYERGDFDEARAVMLDAIKTVRSDDVDELLACRNLLCKIERGAKRYYEALRIHIEAYPLSQLSGLHRQRANFHHGLAATYQLIGDNTDRTLVEYEAASFHLEQAGETSGAGYIENNIALLLSEIGQVEESRIHLERARKLFKGNAVCLAEVDETAAQICLSEDRTREALILALDANRVFIERGAERQDRKVGRDNLYV